ncbi:MAG: ABC transporter ATP-binding protein [Chloroflexi bacterium]|nr:ABC transporter ATP-binding protein [Chloroflexota bacterium]
MSDTFVHLHAVSAGYFQGRKPPTVVVQPFSAALPAGKLVCLIGPNGAGKSTLLRTIAGMQNPVGGRVDLRGSDIHRMTAAERARQLSVVLTQRTEVGMFTGYALVAMGRHPYTSWNGQLSAHDHAVIRESLQLVGALHLAGRPVNAMSDGERQKIMIARALAQEPDLMILDEPTAYLDLPRRVEVIALLRGLARRTGRTILMSTHDLDLALRTADQLWLIDDRGQVTTGLPEDLVLQGAFEAAFASANVEFDLETGAFKTNGMGKRPIVLQGDGVAYVWTRRALEREGYTVVSEAAAGVPRVTITQNGGHPWTLAVGGETHSADSINALMAALGASPA